MSKKKDSLKPWLSRPTVNRSVTLPLTRPLTQRLSNLNEFHPNELDPYLLFDAQDSMIGTLENPTLDLDPSKPDTLNVITATRAGVATFTDVNGNIATAPANTVRVDQTQGAELTPTKFQRVGYTDFSQGWAAQSGVVAQGADDYQGNAVRRLTFDGVTTGGIYQTTINTIGGVSYTGSFYIRRISGSTPLYMRHGFSASGNQTAISVTTEWQQFSVTMLGASGGGNVYFGILQFGAGNDVYEITQPQFEEGTTASDFVANTTGSPKFITGATFGPRVPMILVEPSATNLVTYSEDFSNAAWIKSAVGTGVAPVVTLNAAESPDGTQNANKIVFDSGSGTTTNDLSTLEDYFNTTSGTSYTQSIYLKGESGGEKILLRNAGNSSYTTVTLTTEWARYSVTETAALNFGYYSIGLRQGLGGVVINSKITVYAYGAQVETGSVATSLIPTSGSTVTRAADDLVISGSDFSDFYNASEGTFYVESITNKADGQPFIFSADNSADSSENNTIVVYYSDTTTTTGFIRTSGSIQAVLAIGSRPSAGALSRTSLSYKTNDIEGSVDGGSVASDTSATIPTTINRLSIGTRLTLEDAYKLNGRIRRLIFWPYHSDSL
ncbi:tail protein [uncultured phage_MedDCM-OCT-S45-C18]|uniref:Uncharacterized protein n=1 Tax=uncultured phage_MedDCM-OCT-S45-C18 TaxID=2741072 RepID=A0A6S4P9Z6_9CAUD|nr:tail protein [uncultured phage_MedDCM-OCT-S45-C18]BAQ94262.1 hypothetical protein [uncultured phage_MedDCM-OCT-S45-C18]